VLSCAWVNGLVEFELSTGYNTCLQVMQFGEMQYGSCHTNNPQGEQQHNYHINYQQPNINQNNLFSPFG